MNESIVEVIVKINLEELANGHYNGIGGYDEEGDPYRGKLKFEEVIASMAASQLLEKISREDRYNINQQWMQIRDEEIRKHVEPLVLKAITEPVQKTDSWGKPQGEPQELRDLIVAKAQETLNAKYDSQGRRSSYGSDKTLLENVIEREVSYAFNQELKKVVTEQKAQARKAVEAKAAEIIAGTITELAAGK